VSFTWDHANDVSTGEDGIDFLSPIVLASVMGIKLQLEEESRR